MADFPAMGLAKVTFKTCVVIQGDVAPESMSLEDLRERTLFTGTEQECLLYMRQQARQGVAALSAHEITFVIESVDISQVYREIRGES